MPNNKKKKKGKEHKLKARRGATAAASMIPSFLQDCTNPTSCDDCLFAFPPGCLHSLREDERGSPEIYKVMTVFEQYHAELTGHRDSNSSSSNLLFWDRPENVPFFNERMVRFYLYMIIKTLLREGSDRDDLKKKAHKQLESLLALWRDVKCGSQAASQEEPVCKEREDVRLMFAALNDIHQESYYGLVYVLNELSPCDCLLAELERARKEAMEDESGEKEKLQWRCSNHCGNVELPEDNDNHEPYNCCSKCKMTVYCSPECQKMHWNSERAGEGIVKLAPHKKTCKDIRELVSMLAGNHRSTSDGPRVGRDASTHNGAA